MKKDQCTPHGIINEHTVSCWHKKIKEIKEIEVLLDVIADNVRHVKRSIKDYGIDRMKDYDDFLKFLKYNKKELHKHQKSLQKKIGNAQAACEHEWEPYFGCMFICRKCGKIASDIETGGLDPRCHNDGNIRSL